jgi:hypothetical protein
MNLNELKAVALAATPGPWECELTGLKDSPFGDTRSWIVDLKEHIFEFHFLEGAEAKFIAAANPATILKLIAVVEAAKGLDKHGGFAVLLDALKNLEETP